MSHFFINCVYNVQPDGNRCWFSIHVMYGFDCLLVSMRMCLNDITSDEHGLSVYKKLKPKPRPTQTNSDCLMMKPNQWFQFENV